MSKNTLPQFTIKQLLEAGAHFGHKTMRRNPKMSKYIHSNRNGISIIDLNKTAMSMHKAMVTVNEIAKNNGRILFVATKKQAADAVCAAAKRCGQYYVNFRWLGGMLTNWKTVSQSIKTLKKIEEQLAGAEIDFNKKEKLVLERKRIKLEQALGGIKNMGGYPDLVVIIDTHKEAIAIYEAKRLHIPIMAVVDTNCNPDPITYVIPGNDDSTKAIKLYVNLLSDAIIAGLRDNMVAAGVDLSKVEEGALPDMTKFAKPEEKKSHARHDSRDSRDSRHDKKISLKKEDKKEEKTEAKEEKSEAKSETKSEEAKAAKPAAKKPAAKKPAAKK